MSATAVLQAYFKAFNKHDPEGVAALFGKAGKYVDSAVSAGVKGEALKQYLRGHYAAFPDARYRVLRVVAERGGQLACEWRFTGTNTGALGDSPPTHRAVDVAGASLLQVRGGKIAWLHGYYDRRSLLRQLGL